MQISLAYLCLSLLVIHKDPQRALPRSAIGSHWSKCPLQHNFVLSVLILFAVAGESASVDSQISQSLMFELVYADVVASSVVQEIVAAGSSVVAAVGTCLVVVNSHKKVEFVEIDDKSVLLAAPYSKLDKVQADGKFRRKKAQM